MRLGRTTVTVVTPAQVISPAGLPARSLSAGDGATRRRVPDCNVQPAVHDLALGGVTLRLVGATVHAPASAGITDELALEVDGQAYAVHGTPRVWRPRSGRGRFLLLDAITWDGIAGFWRHDTLVERWTGTGPTGPRLDPPTPVPGLVRAGARLVRSASGDEVVSSTTVYYPVDTPPIPAGSYVTPPAAMGSRSRVITSAVLAGGGLDTPDHLEVTLE